MFISPAQSVRLAYRGGQGCSWSNRLPGQMGIRRPRDIVSADGEVANSSIVRFRQGPRRARIAPGWLRPPHSVLKPESLRRRITAPLYTFGQARRCPCLQSCLAVWCFGPGRSRGSFYGASTWEVLPHRAQRLFDCDGKAKHVHDSRMFCHPAVGGSRTAQSDSAGHITRSCTVAFIHRGVFVGGGRGGR